MNSSGHVESQSVMKLSPFFILFSRSHLFHIKISAFFNFFPKSELYTTSDTLGGRGEQGKLIVVLVHQPIRAVGSFLLRFLCCVPITTRATMSEL